MVIALRSAAGLNVSQTAAGVVRFSTTSGGYGEYGPKKRSFVVEHCVGQCLVIS